MKVLIGCERSRVVAQEFEARGHEVLSCDLEPARRGGAHFRGNVFDVIDFPWDLGLFYFPCTESSVSGARHFPAKKLDGRYYAGNALWLKGWRRASHIRAVGFEHPVSVMSSLFRKPDQVLQPWMFGDFETKATCLWLRSLPLLVPTYRSIDECREALGLAAGAKPADRIHKMPPGPDRAEKRSETFPGIAAAKAAQWGGSAAMTRVA